MKIFKHQRISLFLFLVLYRIAQEMYYVKFIVPIYSYAGYINDASLSRYIISWAFFIGMALLFIKAMFGKDRFWSNVSFVLLLLKFTPLTILLGYISYEKAYIVTNFIFWFMFVVLCNNMPSIKIVSDDCIEKHNRCLKNLFYIVIGLFVISVLYISIRYTGFHLHTSLFDVYDIRFEQRENSYPTVFRYILAASTLLCPLVICYFLDKKKYFLAFVFAIIIYIDFSIVGLKSIVFATVIGIIIRLYYKQYYLRYIPLLASIFIILISFVKNTTIQLGVSFVFWRVFYVPSGMDYEYYTFFNLFEQDYYRNSIFSRFGMNSPYSSTSVDIAVGEYFSPEVEGIRANNGLISEAYANFGNEGCFILPFILVVYFKIISSCAKGVNESYMFFIAVIFSYAIISTFIPATFLSSGVWALLIILISYRTNPQKTL